MGRLPIAQYPDITPPVVDVSGTYTGANAVNVEQSVATPIEQKVNGVENMIYMKSINSSDGNMSLDVSFEVGTDLDIANVLTQNRVSEAEASLPEEVKRLGVTVKKKLSFPLLLVTLISPDGTYDAEFLSNYGTINVIDELARIRGVGSAEVLGGSRVRHAGLGPTGPAGQAGPDRPGHHQRAPAAERPGPGRPDRRAAGAGRHRVHLHGADPRAARDARSSSARSSCARIPTAPRCCSRTWPGSSWAPRTTP